MKIAPFRCLERFSSSASSTIRSNERERERERERESACELCNAVKRVIRLAQLIVGRPAGDVFKADVVSNLARQAAGETCFVSLRLLTSLDGIGHECSNRTTGQSNG
jgi:hypothetical protein